MNGNIRLKTFASVIVVLASLAASSPAALVAAQVKPDNSKVNKADRESSTPTADQQKNNRSDLETTRQIRRAIVTDKSLSTYAHNIKVITQDGKVTLRGPVRTDAEKEKVQAKAAEVAGASNVISDVSVVPAKPRKQNAS